MRKFFTLFVFAITCFATQMAIAGPKVEFKTTMGKIGRAHV